MQKNIRHSLIVLISILMTSAVYAESEIEKNLGSKIKTVLGQDAVINSVSPTPIADLYEIVFDNSKVVYMSNDGRYVLEGDLLDLVARSNLTEERRANAREIAFKNTDINRLIEFAPEKTEHLLYVYTDIDCAYCRKFHSEVKKLNDNGIAIRYLAFPRAGIGSQAFKDAESAWCADDKKQALTDAKAGKSIESKVCDTRVEDQFNLGKSMGVRGTPSVFLENGREMGGYIPADDLIRFFKGGL